MPHSPTAEEYVSNLTAGDPGFVRDIHPADEMFSHELSAFGGAEAAAIQYFGTGKLIADALVAALEWRFPGRPPASVLDFASGFGRTTRFLARRLAPGSLTVSEIDPEAVAFQKGSFRVTGFRSAREAKTFRPDGTFDAVCAVSFFSHLPEQEFTEWLARLWDLVRPGGLLLFSTHGPALRPGSADWSRGIVFDALSETLRLDPRVYGTSWVLPEFVAEVSHRVTSGQGVLHAIPFGLCGHQDLYLLSKEPETPRRRPAIPVVPRGALYKFEMRGCASILAEGLVEKDGEPDVHFLVRNEVRSISPRPSVASRRAWTFALAFDPEISPDDLLRIEARSRGGATKILAMGTLRPYL